VRGESPRNLFLLFLHRYLAVLGDFADAEWVGRGGNTESVPRVSRAEGNAQYESRQESPKIQTTAKES